MKDPVKPKPTPERRQLFVRVYLSLIAAGRYGCTDSPPQMCEDALRLTKDIELAMVTLESKGEL